MSKIFEFVEYNDLGRVHVNLSEEAWLVIKQDQLNFWNLDKPSTLSGFLNIIFANYYQQAKASLYIRTEEKRNELDLQYPDNATGRPYKKDFENLKLNEIRIEERRIIKEQILTNYIKEITNTIENYPKGVGFKFKLNKANEELINDLLEGEYYKGSLGKYLKALFEEYSRLPSYERERVFFKDIYDDFNNALDNKKQLRLSLKKRLKAGSDETYVERKFNFSPYKVVVDQSSNYNYLVGFAEEIDKSGIKLEKKISSFRLSRIAKSKILISLSGFISLKDKETINNTIKSKNIAYIIGDVVEITIKFTKKGLEHYKKQLYMRPNNYEIKDNEKLIYVFYCTEEQAKNYFFKLGKDIEVLEPESLRNNFINRYETALAVYKK